MAAVHELELQVSSHFRWERVLGPFPAVLVVVGMLQAWNKPEAICAAPMGLCALGTSASASVLIVLGVLALAAAVTWARLVARQPAARRVVWDDVGVRLVEGSMVATSITWADASVTIEKNEAGQPVSIEVRDDEGRAIVVHAEARRAHVREPLFVPALDELAKVAQRAAHVRERTEEKPEVIGWLLAASMSSSIGVLVGQRCPALFPALAIALWIARAPLWLRRERRASLASVPRPDSGGPYRARPNVSTAAMPDPSTRWAIADVAIGVLALVALLVLD